MYNLLVRLKSVIKVALRKPFYYNTRKLQSFKFKSSNMLLLITEAISPADIMSIVLKLISKYYTTLEYLDLSNCSLEETRLLPLLASVQNTIFLQHL